MNKKGGAVFAKDGFLFICNDQIKNMAKHHYKCDSPGCPAQLTTIGFTQVKELTIEHDCLGSDMILYYLMLWYLCQAIPFNKDLTSTELCEARELPPEAGRHRQKNFPNGGEWIGTAKSPTQENNRFLTAFLKEVDINNFVVLFIILEVKPVPCAH
ncbi:hypothetical protein DSO57_1005644 [Entomophthora muscae]|uniref:Uncharacterized protein n=1 Tax=Entomophthora muscae TaxID=34485 RepID=A0ACC2SA33_9FUNG|nr:hypothetical protein DSO57_1005644 [Entomophthora muscae]